MSCEGPGAYGSIRQDQEPRHAPVKVQQVLHDCFRPAELDAAVHPAENRRDR
jgi:hypothetical protein